MQKTIPLEHGKYYHIYNCGINSSYIFTENTNYKYFLKLYKKHITPVADTFAWVLMPNHFHFLIRIKEITELQHLSGLENLKGVSSIKPTHQYFSNLFNAYTKAFNKKNNRTGSLFEKPFHRKLIDDEKYLKYMVFYIHNNPVHHSFVEKIGDYFWTSFNSFLSSKSSYLMRDEVINWFDDKKNFIFFHNQQQELSLLRELVDDIA